MKEKKSSEGFMVANLKVKASVEFRDAVGELADRAGISMNEWIVRTIAQNIGRPELATIPRKRMGRPRKLALASKN